MLAATLEFGLATFVSINATLNAAEATTVDWELLVVGAGPAGAVLARSATLCGMRVLLVDRRSFPREKVCGGCLSARTVEQFDSVGLGGVLRDLGAPPLRRLRLGGWKRMADLPLPRGLAVSRRTLDAALVRAAIDAGVCFLPGHLAALGPLRGGTREVILRAAAESHAARAQTVVDASGLGSCLLGPPHSRRAPSRRRLGCSTVVEARGSTYRSGSIHMAVGSSGYVGATRLEDGRLNIAAALDPKETRVRGPGLVVQRTLREAGFEPVDGLGAAAWSGTPQLSQQPRHLAVERVFAVGDAAGYVEPFTGEGIGWALRSAALLAPIVSRAAEGWSDELVTTWSETYRSELARGQRACRVLSWLLRHPLAARCALTVLERRPALGLPLVRRLHAPRLVEEGAAWR